VPKTDAGKDSAVGAGGEPEPAETTGASPLEHSHDDTSEVTLPTCSCGHDRNHYMVSPKCSYSGWGWFWVTVMGVSKTPVKAVFRCRKCGEIIEETDDPAVLEKLT
jgi:hypothetical protein